MGVEVSNLISTQGRAGDQVRREIHQPIPVVAIRTNAPLPATQRVTVGLKALTPADMPVSGWSQLLRHFAAQCAPAVAPSQL